MRAAVGLAEIIGDIVIPAPAKRVTDLPMIGLAVISEKRGPVGAHRILLLVQGINMSILDFYGKAERIEDQSFKVTSNGARCLLSDADTRVNLVGYCNTGSMLTYRLDRDVALVLVSAVTLAEDGSSFLATVEYMQKIGADDKASLLKSLETEWKSVLLDQPRSVTSYASVLCSASANDADTTRQVDTLRPCAAALDHSPLEWDPDVQRILIQDAQPPDHDAVTTLVRLFGHTAVRAGMDPSLKGAREHKRLSAEAVQALICNVERLRSHGFTWEYLLNLCQGILKPQYHFTWNEWIKFVRVTTESELTEPVKTNKVRRLESNPSDPA